MSTTEANRRVVVSGSGPSGAITALTLVQHGVPVTLLESGQALPRGAPVRGMGGTQAQLASNLQRWEGPPVSAEEYARLRAQWAER